MNVTVMDVLAPSEAARTLEISRQHLLRLSDQGRVRYIRTPLGRLYPRDAVARLREERRLLAA